MTKKLVLISFVLLSTLSLSAQTSTLTVEKIMQDPKWMGTFPSEIKWDDHSEFIYFKYNRDNDPTDSLYRIAIKKPNVIEKVNWEKEKELVPFNGNFNNKKTLKLYTKDNTLKVYDLKTKKERDIIELSGRIINPVFLANENHIAFQFDNNAFVYSLETGILKKVTNIQSGEKKVDKETEKSDKNNWLRDDNLELLQVVKKREDKKESSKKFNETTKDKEPFEFYLGKKSMTNLQVSPDETFVTFNLLSRGDSDATIVPDYIDASGYTVDLNTRSKVGDNQTQVELAVYNLKKDTVYMVNTGNLPGIKDLPDYVKDYPEKEWEEKVRDVYLSRAYFSENGNHAIVNVRSKDNKDRWIAKLELETGELESLDRQRDEAWIAGPGIGWSMGGGTMGWLPDNKHFYFQSEATGYSHLYLLDVTNGRKRP